MNLTLLPNMLQPIRITQVLQWNIIPHNFFGVCISSHWVLR